MVEIHSQAIGDATSCGNLVDQYARNLAFVISESLIARHLPHFNLSMVTSLNLIVGEPEVLLQSA